MNILIPHSWLLEYLNTSASPTDIQKQLSLCGPSVERIYDKDGEAVYDIEVTTNRVDSMSVRGIAREAAVILQQFGQTATFTDDQLTTLHTTIHNQTPQLNLPLPKITNDPQLCRRLLAVVLANVQRTPTPNWMGQRLLHIDQNVHDSVIDITNYITHELGHPCHAFDYDQVMAMGGEIIVTSAAADKKFVTLDGNEYTTKGGEVVFENAQGEIIDLPSIKGTANTSITATTKNVLLLIDNLDPKKVRFASMSHAIRTVAAQLLEKGVDPHLGMDVLLRGIQLYQELCGAQLASPIYDDFPGQNQPLPVVVSVSKIADYLGVQLPFKTITHILTTLGCQVESTTDEETISVIPPTFRPDITIPADIIEEIARIYGYHNLPSVLMPTAIPLDKPNHFNLSVENTMRHFLAHRGWQEVYTYSMVSEELALQSGYPLTEQLKLQNPLTDDRVFLRRSLLPSLSEIITQHSQRPELSVFEIAKQYQPVAGDIPEQDTYLGLVSTQSYRQVRGDIEALAQQLFITKLTITPLATPSAEYTQQATLSARLPGEDTTKSVVIGQIGILHNGLVGASFHLPQLLTVIQTHPTYQPIPKTTPIIEDLTFEFPDRTAMGEVLDLVRHQSELISSVSLKDVYRQNYTLTIHYQSLDRNLEVSEVEPIRKAVVNAIQTTCKATLIGQI